MQNLTSEQKHQLDSDGYFILERLIDASLIDQMRAELAPYFNGEKMGRNDFEGFCTERVYALLAKAPSVARIIEHPAILAIVDQLLPPNYQLSAALAINVHPGETAQSFHIDDAAGGAPNSLPRSYYGISTIWALDEFSGTNGATEVVPGSHRWPEMRSPRPEEIRQVLMPAGSVLLFVGNLTHRGGANRSDHTRLAITPQYCMPWMRQLEHMALAVPPELAGRYSPRIQSLLGYNVVDPGFMGYVDGMHPRRLIDPDYQGRKARADLPPS